MANTLKPETNMTDKIAVEPLPYHIAVPESGRPFELYKGEISIILPGTKNLTLIGRVWLAWFPSIEVHFHIDSDPLRAVDNEYLESWRELCAGNNYGGVISIPDMDLSCDVQFTHLSDSDGIVGTIPKGITYTNNKQIKEVVFFLANFPNLGLGKLIRKGEVGARTARYEYTFGNWDLRLDSLPTAPEYAPHKKSSGTYTVSHIARLQTNKNHDFSIDEADEVIKALNLAFSFMRGAWCDCLLVEGHSINSTPNWRSYQRARCHKGSFGGSWHMPVHGAKVDVSMLLQNTIKIMKEEHWSSTLERVISWYVYANTFVSGIEGSVVLAFSALEALSWAIVIERHQRIGPNGFKKLPAADKISLLLLECNIPLEIPVELPELRAFASGYNYNGPLALADFRNSLAHWSHVAPNGHRVRGEDSTVQNQCARLSIHYLERSILKLCGIEGTFTDRIKNKLDKVSYS